ncbi:MULTISPECIES: SH3 domain-containing protein [Streptomyces]|uniref:SH3 domain-containing protein n=1 Tax=Streptomyces TaxID=1883 RepID=UPI0004CD0116|nr:MULTISPECIES: SH3 domain-containing protein [Streptomyces]KOT62942.1 hypothetical protein ADK43_09165 [Streptomyces rimosus subsp. rimosus]
MQDVCTTPSPDSVRPLRRLAAVRRTASLAVAGALLAGGIVTTAAGPAAAAGTCSRSTVPIANSHSGARAENVAGTITTSGGPVHLRSGPGTQYRSTAQLRNGEIVIGRCTARGDAWVYLHVMTGPHEGKSGWAYRKYTNLIAPR